MHTLSARLAYVPPPVAAAVPEALPIRDEPDTASVTQRPAARSSTKAVLDATPAVRAQRAAVAGAELPDSTYYPAKQLDVYPALSMPLDLRPAVRHAAAPLTGRALLLVLIDEAGVVRDVSVVEAEPSGYGADDAKGAFMSARFTPAYRNGRPVKSRVLVEITYGKERTE